MPQIIFFLLLLLPFTAGAFVPPGDERIKRALGEITREAIRETHPLATETQVQKTLDKMGSNFRYLANNPVYPSTATRWLTVGIRVLNRVNPYLVIAFELCYWQGYCAPNPQLKIRETKADDSIISEHSYAQPRPSMPINTVYFAGHTVPRADFTCGGSNYFIRHGAYGDVPSYFPGSGSPCRVQAGQPDAVQASEGYIGEFVDYFGFSPGDLTYTQTSTMTQVLGKPSIVCNSIGTGPNPSIDEHPYWPCISKQVDDSGFIYEDGEGNPHTYRFYVGTDLGQIQIVTDFPMTNLQLYPIAPVKGRIELYQWQSQLTQTDLVSAVSVDVLAQIALSNWIEAQQLVGYDGLPAPSSISQETMTKTLTKLQQDLAWPTIEDFLDPIEDQQDFTPDRYQDPKPKPAKQYVFRWNCGFADFPRCIFEFISPSLKPDVDLIPLSGDPFDPLSVDPVTPQNHFSKYLSSRLSGASCTAHHVSGPVLGKSRSIDWDFCPFATVARDVLALMAYFITAGAMFGTLSAGRAKK